MAHEKSETVLRHTKDGPRWFNLDTVGSDAGTILGNRNGYPTMETAVSAAKRRSAGKASKKARAKK